MGVCLGRGWFFGLKPLDLWWIYGFWPKIWNSLRRTHLDGLHLINQNRSKKGPFLVLNIWPKGSKRSKLLLWCPKQAIQPISKAKFWKKWFFGVSKMHPKTPQFGIASTETAKNHPKWPPKPSGMALISIKISKFLIFTIKMGGQKKCIPKV